MTYVRSFDDFTPPARFDGVAFTTALIQEAPDVAGSPGTFSTIDTKTLSPVDADPARPATRDFTTSLATLAIGWYRIIWRDAALAEFVGDPFAFPRRLGDLCTLDDVREFDQIPVGEAETDSIASALIVSASRAITKHCRREFAPPRAALARDFEYRPPGSGVGYLDVDPFDLRAITAVSAGPSASALTTIPAASVRLWTTAPEDGVYTAIKIAGSYAQPGCGDFETAVLRITGDWGFATVPNDVLRACVLTVSIWLRRDVASFASTLNLDTSRLERPEALPWAVLKMLSTYRRIPV